MSTGASWTTRGVAASFCARATSGQLIAPVTSPMNPRRLTLTSLEAAILRQDYRNLRALATKRTAGLARPRRKCLSKPGLGLVTNCAHHQSQMRQRRKNGHLLRSLRGQEQSYARSKLSGSAWRNVLNITEHVSTLRYKR